MPQDPSWSARAPKSPRQSPSPFPFQLVYELLKLGPSEGRPATSQPLLRWSGQAFELSALTSALLATRTKVLVDALDSLCGQAQEPKPRAAVCLLVFWRSGRESSKSTPSLHTLVRTCCNGRNVRQTFLSEWQGWSRGLRQSFRPAYCDFWNR
eukprot:2968679-Amphidinium_carterae.1